jgi:hypothetical protein
MTIILIVVLLEPVKGKTNFMIGGDALSPTV